MLQEIEEHILIHLEDLNFLGENLQTKLQNRIDIIKKHLLEKTSSKDEICNTLVNLIDSNSVRLKIEKIIKNLSVRPILISTYSYEDDSNIKEIIELMSLMKNYVTPNEIITDRKKPLSRPANIISILNASWLFYLFNINIHYKLLLEDDEKEDPESRAKVLQRLNNLTLKGIELSKIHERIKRKTKYGRTI